MFVKSGLDRGNSKRKGSEVRVSLGCWSYSKENTGEKFLTSHYLDSSLHSGVLY